MNDEISNKQQIIFTMDLIKMGWPGYKIKGIFFHWRLSKHLKIKDIVKQNNHFLQLRELQSDWISILMALIR